MKTPPKKKSITLDDLVRMTQRGFDGPHQEMTKGITGGNARLDQNETHLASIEQRSPSSGLPSLTVSRL